MNYTIRIEKLAEKFILKQPEDERRRLLQAIYKLPYEGVYSGTDPGGNRPALYFGARRF